MTHLHAHLITAHLPKEQTDSQTNPKKTHRTTVLQEW